jgi:hypothetical protein
MPAMREKITIKEGIWGQVLFLVSLSGMVETPRL